MTFASGRSIRFVNSALAPCRGVSTATSQFLLDIRPRRRGASAIATLRKLIKTLGCEANVLINNSHAPARQGSPAKNLSVARSVRQSRPTWPAQPSSSAASKPTLPS